MLPPAACAAHRCSEPAFSRSRRWRGSRRSQKRCSRKTNWGLPTGRPPIWCLARCATSMSFRPRKVGSSASSLCSSSSPLPCCSCARAVFLAFLALTSARRCHQSHDDHDVHVASKCQLVHRRAQGVRAPARSAVHPPRPRRARRASADMIYELDEVRRGFDIDCDAVVVGSGAGGAMAAANLARAGLRTVVLEAGPRIRAEDMTRDAPLFLARYFWDGGLRMIGGTTQIPSLQGRCLGGATVVNSAIMLELPAWVRSIWREQPGVQLFEGPALARAYQRVFERLGVGPTPMAVMGRRNLTVKRALEAVGIAGAPLPRAVVDCKGCGDCLTGCVDGS